VSQNRQIWASLSSQNRHFVRVNGYFEGFLCLPWKKGGCRAKRVEARTNQCNEILSNTTNFLCNLYIMMRELEPGLIVSAVVCLILFLDFNFGIVTRELFQYKVGQPIFSDKVYNIFNRELQK
jgi:hypothetical protein